MSSTPLDGTPSRSSECRTCRSVDPGPDSESGGWPKPEPSDHACRARGHPSKNKGHEPIRCRRKIRGGEKSSPGMLVLGGVFRISYYRCRSSRGRAKSASAQSPDASWRKSRQRVRAQPVNKKTELKQLKKRRAAQLPFSVSVHVPVMFGSQRPEPLQLSAAYYRKLTVSMPCQHCSSGQRQRAHQTRRKFDSLRGMLWARLGKSLTSCRFRQRHGWCRGHRQSASACREEAPAAAHPCAHSGRPWNRPG